MDPKDAAVLHRVRQIVRIHECDEAESAMARAVWNQAEARDPAPEPNEKLILAAAAAFVIVIIIVGTLAWMGW